MPAVTVQDESIKHDGFYVPQFEVRIQGVGLPQDVLRDITQLTYHDNTKEIDGFELTVNNWDSTVQNFKYIGAENAASLQKNPLYRLFEPCNKEVEVWMGYLGDLRLMLKGTFVAMEPNFPSGGAADAGGAGLKRTAAVALPAIHYHLGHHCREAARLAGQRSGREYCRPAGRQRQEALSAAHRDRR